MAEFNIELSHTYLLALWSQWLWIFHLKFKTLEVNIVNLLNGSHISQTLPHCAQQGKCWKTN